MDMQIGALLLGLMTNLSLIVVSPAEYTAGTQSQPREGRRRKGRYDFVSRDKKGHLTVTLKKYRGKGLDYVMAASGRIQMIQTKKTQSQPLHHLG
jgi:hypothetical protein